MGILFGEGSVFRSFSMEAEDAVDQRESDMRVRAWEEGAELEWAARTGDPEAVGDS